MTNDVFSFHTQNFDKFFIGADRMIETLAKSQESLGKCIPGYPPYNITKIDENKYSIELAVAGLTKNNIEIELANNTLTIKGGLMSVDEMAKDTVNPVQYLYKGIADRYFTRKFTLADHVEVKGSALVNGMLKVFLEHAIPESKKPKKIEIEG
jgi:molecular chaperone IbpA